MKKVLILILAYNAEKHIVGVLKRLPDALWHNTEYSAEVVVIDDCSKDATTEVARQYVADISYPVHLLRNPLNQGYGGNQKVGYTYAIKHGFDVVIMLHGDGQYPPEKIHDMVMPIIQGDADAVFGSRIMVKKDALAGGMPLYKFMGNIALTTVQNAMLGSNLSEFHSGFRAYSVAALKRIPFQHNSNVFHFDTDIIIQFVDNNFIIKEIPIPTFYGDEVCHVNGMRYALEVVLSTLLSRIQRFGIFYAPKFDYEKIVVYSDKSRFESSHSYSMAQVNAGERVLDMGCGEGHVAMHLKARGCKIIGCDLVISDATRSHLDVAILMDLNHPDFSAFDARSLDVVLLLDVIEQLRAPEQFLAMLHTWCAETQTRIIITGSNIGFFIQRFMLLLGQFNYSKRGTLDMAHTRLFTFSSLRRTLENAGFNIIDMQGLPAPFPLAIGEGWLASTLLKVNGWLIKLSRSLFSFQIAVVVKPRPTLEWLVEQAVAHGAKAK